MTSVRYDVLDDAVQAGPPLTLLREARLTTLLSPIAPALDRLEASGVALQDGLLWVIFDNLPHIAAVHPALFPAPSGAVLIRQNGPAAGYEDIAHDDETGRRFILVEATRTPQGGFRPQIDEFDAGWRRVERRWVALDLEQRNKGLEGLTFVRRGGSEYLLALSEGNRQHGGWRGRRPGGGLIHVLERGDEMWRVAARIELPHDLRFADYSALSLHGERLAVVSQESSALWVGTLDGRDWRIASAGTVYPFPRDRRGRVRYGTPEGVTWIDERTVAVVSDRSKPDQPHRLRRTAESIHVFALGPESSVGTGDAGG